jgi:hypothetical protein
LQQCCFSLEAISGWLPDIAQKKVLLLSEKPVIHDAGLIDVGLHQSAGMQVLGLGHLWLSGWTVGPT